MNPLTQWTEDVLVELENQKQMSGVWVFGDGPSPALVMLVGERPGLEEFRSGRPFSEYGKSGKEIRRYLFNEGIRFEDCYVTNVCKDYLEGNPDPTPAEIKRDSPLLIEELKSVKPKFIGAVGRFAAQELIGPEFVGMEVHRGLPFFYLVCWSCGEILRQGHESHTQSKGLLDLVKRKNRRQEGETCYLDQGSSSASSRLLISHSGGKNSEGKTSAPSLPKSSLCESLSSSASNSASTQTATPGDGMQIRASIGRGERLHSPKDDAKRERMQALSEDQKSEISCENCGQKLDRVVIMALLHPAYGLHSAHATPLVWDDFRSFGKLVRGEEVVEVPEDHLVADYQLLKDKLPRFLVDQPIYVDTEGSAVCPWGLSFTQEPGKGFVILAQNKALLKRFAAVIKKLDLEVVCHPVIHDLGVLRAMGVEFSRYRCTMTKAYLNTLVPQGLKPLARRLCGVVQEDYEDVMAQANKDKAVDWLMKAWEWTQINAHSITSTRR